MRGRSRANLEAPRRYVGVVMQMAIAAVFAAPFTILVSAQEFMAGPGTPAAAFPKPDRPVADIVTPIWHGEEERDDAGEPTQLVHQLGIKSGMTIADNRRRQRLLRGTAVPDCRPPWPYYRRRCRARILAGLAQSGGRSWIGKR
jgi:hypothetical protein